MAKPPDWFTKHSPTPREYLGQLRNMLLKQLGIIVPPDVISGILKEMIAERVRNRVRAWAKMHSVSQIRRLTEMLDRYGKAWPGDEAVAEDYPRLPIKTDGPPKDDQ